MTRGMLEPDSVPPEMRVVYADDGFAVVMKLCGELCEAGVSKSGLDGDGDFYLPRLIRPVLEKRLGHRVDFCECVHRLDRPVTGLCVLALDPAVCARLSSMFASGQVRKTYLAIVERPRECRPTDIVASTESREPVRLSGRMVFDTKKQKAFLVSDAVRSARRAELVYRTIGEGERYIFVQVEPLTGRTHQIRCQLAAAGLCIKGDVKYGARRSDPIGGIRLHAWRISFPNPYAEGELVFSAPPPCVDSLWEACLSCVSGEGM